MGNKLKNIRILITGGAGFIGSHLADELLSRGCQVVVIDNLINGKEDNLKLALQNSNFTFIKVDILNQHDIEKALKDVEIIYHMACLGVRHSINKPYENHLTNAEGSLKLLLKAKEFKIKKLFYISSSEIYGKALSFPIKESDTPYPITVYGASKLVGEHYANSFHECYGMDSTVIRLFNNFGPRAHYEGDSGEVIPRTIVRALYNKNPVIFGDGTISKDFIFVKDTARILADLIDIEGLTGNTYNIGSGEEITMKKLMEDILTIIGDPKLKIEYDTARPADVPRLLVDSNKLRKKYNFKLNYSFSQGLIETVNFYRNLMKEKDLINEMPLKNW
jgi:UDP-glucose 4-epimerase